MRKMKSQSKMSDAREADCLESTQDSPESVAARASRADMEDPRVVLSLLEADQVVAAKSQTHFGCRKLSPGARVLLWGLRIYVLLMMAIVVISVIHAFHAH